MKQLRVLLLVHEDLVPPDSTSAKERESGEWKTEYDVQQALKKLSHEVKVVGVRTGLRPIYESVTEWKPNVVFNLLEEFDGESLFDQHVVSYLELLGIPYTGCSPCGLTLARNKALAKKILTYHRIQIPSFFVCKRGRKVIRTAKHEFPLIVKSITEEASLGISKASIVTNDEKLIERVAFVHEYLGKDAIIESYIEGRELYVGVLGHRRLTVFSPWELFFNQKSSQMPKIATRMLKWNVAYQKKHKIKTGAAKPDLGPIKNQLTHLSKRIYRALDLNGYARLDFRLTQDNQVYFIEANPNPDISRDEDFAASAKALGVDYPTLISKILNLSQK